MTAEFVKLAGLLVGLFVSFWFYQGLADGLAQGTFLNPELAEVLVMTALISLVYFLVVKGLRGLEKVVQINFNPKMKAIGGFLVGLPRAMLVASVILVICRQFNSPYMDASIEEKSFCGTTISRMAPAVYDVAIPLFKRLGGVE